MRVLNTRSSSDAGQLSIAINNSRGVAIELATLEIIATPTAKWLKSIANLDTVDIIIFISKNAVRFFIAALAQKQLNISASSKLIAIGQGTATTLKSFGYAADFIPESSSSEGVLTLDILQQVQDKQILLVKGIGGRTSIASNLRQRNAVLNTICVYRRQIPKHNPEYVSSIWQEQKIDIIIFTSGQAIRNLLSMYPSSEANKWLLNLPIIVISSRLQKLAQQLGFTKISCCEYANIIQALQGYKNEQS